MGTEIDVISTKWRKKKQTFYRPVAEKVINKKEIEDRRYWLEVIEVLYDTKGLTYSGDFHEPFFEKADLEKYLSRAASFFEQVKKLPENPLKDWLLENQNGFIHYNQKSLILSNKIEEYEQNIWEYEEDLDFNVESKSFYRIAGKLKSEFGVDIFPSFVTADELYYYDERESYSKELDNKLTSDTTLLGIEVQQVIDKINNEDKETFKYMLPYLEVYATYLKRNAKFLYSS